MKEIERERGREGREKLREAKRDWGGGGVKRERERRRGRDRELELENFTGVVV